VHGGGIQKPLRPRLASIASLPEGRNGRLPQIHIPQSNLSTGPGQIPFSGKKQPPKVIDYFYSNERFPDSIESAANRAECALLGGLHKDNALQTFSYARTPSSLSDIYEALHKS